MRPAAPGQAASLRTRLAVVVGAVVAVAIGLAAGGSYLATSRGLYRSVDSDLSRRATVAVGAPAQVRGFLDGGPRRLPGVIGPDVTVQFVDRHGRVDALGQDQPALPVGRRAARLLASSIAGRTFDTVSLDGQRYRLLTLALGDGGAIQIGRGLDSIEMVLGSLRARLSLMALAGSALAAGVAWGVVGRYTRPVRELTLAAEHVAATQDPSAPIAAPDGRGDDEVARLARSFNTMLAALAGSRRQQHQLIRDASHELRTPLTSLRTNLELAARATDLQPADRKALLDAAVAELAELAELVTEMTELATDARAEEPVTTVDLGELAEAVAARFRRRTGRTVTVSGSAPSIAAPSIAAGSIAAGSIVRGRAGALERAIANLVDNACKFSPPPTPVSVSVEGGTLTVYDQGPGIAAADRDRVFDRFHRGESVQSLPGSGLGLAIVAQVVADHGGRVFVGTADGTTPRTQGGAVGFELPVIGPGDQPHHDEPRQPQHGPSGH